MTKITSKIGAHVSFAGGIDKAPSRAAELECEVFQCFSRSPQGGKAPELTQELIAGFKAEMQKNSISDFYIHAPYYINLASLEPRIRHGSISVLRDELERGTVLGAKYVMAHVGSHTGQTLQEGIGKVIAGLQEILAGYKGTTELLVEISAGSGNVIGDTFREVGEIVHGVNTAVGFGGICFDTCHAFASGYDFRTKEGAGTALEEFDRHIGLRNLKLTHVNDSMGELGSRKDRHEHIGKGHIGLAGFEAILTAKQFRNIDWILETDDVGRKDDVGELKKIRQKY